MFARLAERIPRRPRVLWVGSTLVLVLLALGLTGLDTTLTQQQQFTDDVEAVRGQELLASGFPAGASAPASVFVPAGADVDAVRGALEDAPGAASVGAAREGPPGTLVTVVLDGDPYAPGTVDQIPALRTAVGEAGRTRSSAARPPRSTTSARPPTATTSSSPRLRSRSCC